MHRRQTMEISLWLRDSKKTPHYAQIYCRITIAGERVNIGSTGLTIHRDHWDPDKKRVKNLDPVAEFKNDQLARLEMELYGTHYELTHKETTLTADKVKRAYHNKGTTSVTMTSAFDLFLKAVRTDPDRSGATAGVYNTCRKKLVTFLINHKLQHVLAEDFDLKVMEKYRRWMQTLPQENGQKGHAPSYVRKHSQIVLQVLKWAKLHQIAKHNPLDGYRVPGVQEEDPIYLTDAQFEQLLSHQFKRKALQRVADVFIVLCRTGFHYGDLKDFVKKHKTALRTGLDGNKWLVKARIKTDVTAKLPLFEEVDQIVGSYGGWQKLPLPSLKTMNANLKVIAHQLDLPEKLSTKAGRKTFTDWCFNHLELTTDAVLVMLGRKSDKGLGVYGRPDERRVIGELKKSKTYQERPRRQAS